MCTLWVLGDQALHTHKCTHKVEPANEEDNCIIWTKEFKVSDLLCITCGVCKTINKLKLKQLPPVLWSYFKVAQ